MSGALQNALPAVTGILFGLSLLLIAISLRLFRRSRTDVFWRRRRQASQRGMRVLSLGVILFVLSGLACVVTLFVAVVSDGDDSTAASELPSADRASGTPTTAIAQPPPDAPTATEVQVTAAPDGTSTPVVVVVTATPLPTTTATTFPTFTPNITPLVSLITPAANASLQIVALDDQISDSLRPVNPRTVFLAGTRRIYLFLAYSNMTEGVLWRRTLMRDAELIDSGTYLWGQSGSGSTYFFFGAAEGFAPGLYEIQLFLGESESPISSVSFVVTPPS